MSAISGSEFIQLLEPLRELPIVNASNSFGSAIHLNFRAPAPFHSDALEQTLPDLIAGIHLYWDWRLEDAGLILCGSSNQRSEISGTLGKLIGLNISEFVIEPLVPDLTIIFSNGWHLRSMSLRAGDPEWNIVLPDKSRLRGKNGQLSHTLSEISEDYHPDPFASRLSVIASEADRRWIEHSSQSDDGNCGECQFFIKLDGPAAFLWYGACSCADSPFDGRVVHQGSGCAGFCARYETPFP
jgi:hypothetical protein